MKVHRVWYVPGHVPDYDTAETEEEAIETITLLVFNDAQPEDYVPVFDNLQACDAFVRDLAEEHQDLAFAVCSFRSISDIEDKLKEEFDRDVKLLIQESTSEV